MQNPKHIHLIGICGTAMASLAGMLQLQGHRITGSDAAAYPPMSDLLAGLKIPIHEPYLREQSRAASGLSWSLGTRFRVEMLSSNMCSILAFLFVRWLRFCMTSSCQGGSRWLSRGRMGRPRLPACWPGSMRSLRGGTPAFAPSFLIGGVAENFGTSFMVRPTRPFLLEGDEYDTAFFDKGPKFLHYFPDAADSDPCRVRSC